MKDGGRLLFPAVFFFAVNVRAPGLAFRRTAVNGSDRRPDTRFDLAAKACRAKAISAEVEGHHVRQLGAPTVFFALDLTADERRAAATARLGFGRIAHGRVRWHTPVDDG
jgi:hypothetical protein